MSDEMERRLREAFDAKASQITPEMIDAGREQEFAQEMRRGAGSRRRGLALAGLGTAAAAAAALTIGVVVTNHQGTPRPALAATGTLTTASASPSTPAPKVSSSMGLETHTAQPPAPPQHTTTTTPPPTTTSTTQPPRQSTKAETAPPPTMSPPPTGPDGPSSPSTSGSTGDFILHGTLRQAAGVDFLPLPSDVTRTVVDQTSRTTRLHTDDCAAVLSYWETAMPQNGWKRAPAAATDRWFAPTGDAWAFTDAPTGSCTIQISAGP